MKGSVNASHLKPGFYWKPLFAVVVWGFSFIAIKYALEEIKPATIVFIRQLLGIAFLGAIAIKQKSGFAIAKKDFRWVLLLGLITSLHLWIQVTGLQYTSASNTGWIIGITPVFMTIAGFLFFKEKAGLSQIAGIALSFFGLLLLVGKGDFSTIDIIKNKGDLLIITSSLTWAIYSIAAKKAAMSFSPLMATFYLFVVMALVTAPFTINGEDISRVINLSSKAWLAILFLGIFCSGVGYYIWAQTLKEMSASQAGAFLYLEPFVTFFSAALLLNEHLSLITFISGIIIITGVILVNRK